MPILSFYATSAQQLSDGDVSWINLENVNNVVDQSPENQKPQTVTALTPGQTANTILFTGFDINYPFGASVDGYRFYIEKDSIPIDAEEAENVKDFEVYIYKNGIIDSTNISQLDDWTYHNGQYGLTDTFIHPISSEEFEASNFGISIKPKNTSLDTGVKPVFYSVYLNLYVSNSHPKFLYNGDSTSEVFIDIVEGDTTSETVFQIFHGDADTTSTGTNMGYVWGVAYTPPVLGDPASGFSNLYLHQPTGEMGTYDINYLITDVASSTDDTGTYCCYNITDHTMSYDVSNLTVGETYRRGLGLINNRYTLSKTYDTLYFNITVLPAPQDTPYFIYNGDSTSEINTTLTVGDSTNINFIIHHVNTHSKVYRWSRLTSDGTSSFTDSSSWLSAIGDNLNTDDAGYCCDNDVTHSLSINSTGLSVGSHRLGIVLSSVSGWVEPYDTTNTIFDVLWVNLIVNNISNPHYLYNGDTTSEINITMNPTDSTTISFQIKHDPLTYNPSVLFGCIGYSYSLHFEEVETTPSIPHYYQNWTFGGGISPAWRSITPNRTIGSGFFNNNPDSYFESGDIEDFSLTISPYTIGSVTLSPGIYRTFLSLNLSGYTASDYETELYYEVDRLYINITIPEDTPQKLKHTGTYSNYIV